MGQSPPGDTYNTEGLGMPFMQGSAEFGEHSPRPVKFCSAPLKIAEVGDLLLSVRAPVGDSNIADQRIAIGRGLAAIRGNEQAITTFLRLLVQSNTRQLLATSGTGMFSSITGKNLRELSIELPPPSEQKRIIDVMASVDAYIAALQQQAVHARSARNAVLHELLTAGGDDWTETTLGEVAALGKGGAWGEDEPGQGLVEAVCLRGTDLADLIDGQHPAAPVRWLKESELTKARCAENMILIETSGSKCGRSVLLTAEMLYAFARPVVFSNFCRTLQIDLNRITNKYAELWFSNAYSNGLIPSYRATSAMPNLDIKSLLRIETILLPPLNEQKRIMDIVSAIDVVIRAAVNAIADAQKLRSGLLSDLLSGEHKIPETYDRLLGAA
jgi:type I restriction enzyme S subunit